MGFGVACDSGRLHISCLPDIVIQTQCNIVTLTLSCELVIGKILFLSITGVIIMFSELYYEASGKSENIDGLVTII